MRFNTVGDVLSDSGAINGVRPAALRGRATITKACWATPTRIAFQAETDNLAVLDDFDLTTGRVTPLSPHGANELRAGGGTIAAMLNGSVRILAWGGVATAPGYVFNDGIGARLLDVDNREGATLGYLAICPVHNQPEALAGRNIAIYGATGGLLHHIPTTPIRDFECYVRSGLLTWVDTEGSHLVDLRSGFPVTIQLAPRTERIVSLKAVEFEGVVYVHELSERLTLREPGATHGWVITEADTFYPDMIAQSSANELMAAWARRPGERDEDVVTLYVDLTRPIVDLNAGVQPPAPPSPPPPPPPVDPPSPPPPPGNVDMPFDWATAQILNSPGDLASWPEATRITALDLTAEGVHVEFTKRDGPGRWPDIIPPGFEGPIQYTLGMVEFCSGVWCVSAVIQVWFGLDRAGGPPAEFQKNWFYAPERWGPMSTHVLQPREIIGFFVASGDCRNGGTNMSVRERSQIVWVEWPNGSMASAPVDPPVDPGTPPVDPPPPPPPPPPATGDLVTIHQDLQDVKADIAALFHGLSEILPSIDASFQTIQARLTTIEATLAHVAPPQAYTAEGQLLGRKITFVLKPVPPTQ